MEHELSQSARRVQDSLQKLGVSLIDENLFQYAEIWAAAGTPNAVFRLMPEELKQITGGAVVSV
jgi:prolyl-tRNA editing enzyme YbaK/EbsC (Cys-tRNA(Pro) deacylase)